MGERVVLVMAGGSGERFWPMSQPTRPKQLLRLTHPSKTMFQEAMERAEDIVGSDNAFLATSATLRPLFAADGFPEGRIFAEPMRRNTLGCLCWAAANLIAKGKADATVGVLTADHEIRGGEEFARNCRTAMEVAEATGAIVTIGIRPTRPETGYGYLELDDAQAQPAPSGVAVLCRRFREKPGLQEAISFLDAGNFAWNSGMFFYTLPAFLRELEHSQPVARRIVDEMASSISEGEAGRAEQAFSELHSESIDKAVMEKAEKVFTVRSDFGWDDVGAWDAVRRTRPADEDNNVAEGPVVLVGTKEAVVWNQTTIPVGVVGLDNVIVVATPDGILVCHADAAQDVRHVATRVAVGNIPS